MPIDFRIRVIVPLKSMFYYDAWVREIKKTMHNKTDPDLKFYFRKTVEGWKGPPTFFAHHFQTPGSIGVQVYSTQKKYGIVNAGYPKRRLTAKRGGIMRFQKGYSPSTQPGSLVSTTSFRFGYWRLARSVLQGVKGREFDSQIAEWYAPIFLEDMEISFKAGTPE